MNNIQNYGIKNNYVLGFKAIKQGIIEQSADKMTENLKIALNKTKNQRTELENQLVESYKNILESIENNKMPSFETKMVPPKIDLLC